jgi:hypothetical protein
MPETAVLVFAAIVVVACAILITFYFPVQAHTPGA